MERDDDELGDSDCLPRLRTKWPRTYVYVCTKATHVRIRTPFIIILCARANPPRRLFEGAFISLSASNCAAFIRGRRLFAEIRYL